MRWKRRDAEGNGSTLLGFAVRNWTPLSASNSTPAFSKAAQMAQRSVSRTEPISASSCAFNTVAKPRRVMRGVFDVGSQHYHSLRK